jgi:hypothetical protein
MSAIASFIQLPMNALVGLKSAAVSKKTFVGSTQDKYDQSSATKRPFRRGISVVWLRAWHATTLLTAAWN